MGVPAGDCHVFSKHTVPGPSFFPHSLCSKPNTYLIVPQTNPKLLQIHWRPDIPFHQARNYPGCKLPSLEKSSGGTISFACSPDGTSIGSSARSSAARWNAEVGVTETEA